MSIIQGNAKQGSTRGFYPKVINGSLRFNDDDSAYLSWTPASAGNQKTWTMSFWFKRGAVITDSIYNHGFLSDSTGGQGIYLRVNPNTEVLEVACGNGNLVTSGLFRDHSAWYHVVVNYDSANSSIALYVNGEQPTLSTNTQPSLNNDGLINNGNTHYIGRQGTLSRYFDGYLANVHFIDGQALTASDFGETKNGVWVAKDYAGTYGTNGFYLTFEDDTQVEAFNTVLYRGTGNGTIQSVTGTGYSPDLVWLKNRTGAYHHRIYDTVRGADRALMSTLTNAETVGGLQSFDSDGFTVNGTTNFNNIAGNSYVAWAWDAGANNAVTGHSSVTYTGNGATQKISGFPFSPDLVWIKNRSAVQHHNLVDSVRGSSQLLYPNLTNAEATTSHVTSFDSDGFILGSTASANGSGNNIVAWGWDAGDSDPVSNTAGTITSTVKSSGDFSIISYTGTGPGSAANEIQVGHGLTSKPDFVIVKRRNSTGDWFVFTDVIDGSNDYLYLNQTVAKGDSGNSVPTDTYINVGGSLNTSGGTYVAYAWRNVTGKQKFGTYTGDGTTDGSNTVELGFRPGFIMVKTVNDVGGWIIMDTSRNPLNRVDKWLYPHLSNAEATYSTLDVTDTGFSFYRSDSPNINGTQYIYAAFAGSYSDYITDYNTDGSIDSRVKANPTTGFSIVSYTGSTSESVGHGLSSAPKFIIVKDRSAASSWAVYHQSVQDTTANGFLELNSTAAVQTGSNPRFLSGTAGTSQPTNTVFYVNNYSGSSTNNTGNNYIAYCWAEKTGYSKFGSYAGNATSVDLGFNPAFILIKRITGTGKAWWLFDNTREVDGQFGDYQIPNEAYPDQTVATAIAVSGTTITFPNNWDSTHDGSASSTYIYAAFADTREAAFWLDQSGNDNDWQPVNLDHNDTVADSPTDNFATLNPLYPASSTATFSDGNLKVVTPTSGYGTSVATIVPSAGQYYAEFTAYDALGMVGIRDVSLAATTATTVADGATNCIGWYSGNGNFYYNGTSVLTAGNTYGSGDVIGVAIDYDAGSVSWYKNGTLEHTQSSLDLTNVTFAVGDFGNTTSATITANFGQQPFKYDPPA